MRTMKLGAAAIAAVTAPLAAQSVERPDVIVFGSTVAEMEANLAALCEGQTSRRIDPPFLPDVENEQMQIDCEGFSFLGLPRHAEFVFRDDSLEMVWVMTEAEEDSAILEQMRAAYGMPSHESEPYVAFVEHRTALRREPPEVLFYSENLAEAYAEFFDANAAE